MSTRFARLRERVAPLRWLSAHPLVADSLLAVALGLLAIAASTAPSDTDYRDTNAFFVVSSIVAIGALALRRRFPVCVFATTVGVALVLTLLDFNANGPANAALIATYTVAAHRPRRVSAWALAALGPVIVAVAFADPADDAEAIVIVGNSVVFVTAWLIGDNMQTRRHYVAALEERALRLEAEREERAARAVADERARVARDLHDVVAHHVSVMVVQAAAARRLLRRGTEQADTALGTVEEVGRQAMREMRAMLGVLRGDAASPELAPQPGLADIPALVEQLSAAGVETQLEIAAPPVEVSDGVALSVYRIVQESLTNVLKHAGPNARARVRVAYDVAANVVCVDVDDDGRGAAAARSPGGQGSVGMEERAAMFGGTIRSGPRAGGGWSVHARLPLTR